MIYPARPRPVRIFPPAPPARLFSLADLCNIAYDFGLCDALDESCATLCLFPADSPTHAAYWEGYQVGISLYYHLVGQRLFVYLDDSSEDYV